MNKFKEKPTLGKAKEKPKSALLPKQAVHMMKEKYIKELDQRPKGTEDSTQQAPNQVEHAGRWAVDKLTGRAVEQGREYAKKKFAAAHGEVQADPEPAPYGDDGPSAEGAPGGQPAQEHPASTPVERQEMEHSPTAPKERPQAEHTANPVKERQVMERRAAPQEQPRPYRTTQTTQSGQPRLRDNAYSLKERPTTQAVKERPAVDMPRTADRNITPKTSAGQTPAAPVKHSEAVPPKLRQQQAWKGRATGGTPRTADSVATPWTTAPSGRSEAVPVKARQQRLLKERPQLNLRGRGTSRPAAASVSGPGGKASRPTKAVLSPKVRRGVVKSPATPTVRSGIPGARAMKNAQRQMQRRIFNQATKPAKNIMIAFRRAIQAVVKAAAAVSGAVSAVVGGAVLLVALVIIIVIAAVANSPFGLFFAQEPNAPDAVSVSQAVGSVNMAL